MADTSQNSDIEKAAEQPEAEAANKANEKPAPREVFRMSNFITFVFIAAFGVLISIAISHYFNRTYDGVKSALWWGLSAYVVLGVATCFAYNEYVIKPIRAAERERALNRDPFAITFAGSLTSYRRDMHTFLWLRYNSKIGFVRSPIHQLINIRLTNLQKVRSMIELYSADIQSADGSWIKLIQMDSTSGVFCYVPEDTKKAKEFALPTLDKVLSSKVIEPNETVEGAAFFELPQDVPDNAPVRFRIKDFGGAEIIRIVKPDNDFGQPWTITNVGVDIDVTGYATRFYSEVPRG